MGNFAHVILTRFNLRRRGHPPPNRDWLRHRVDLFARFCFPSVMGQTNMNFRWFVFVDPETPSDVLVDLRSLGDGAQVMFCPLSGFDVHRATALVRQELGRSVDYLITTTLDNDDAIARGFVDEVQRQFHGQSFELLNFSSGLRLMLGSGKLYAVSLPASPFVSLIETVEAAVTIWGCLPHSSIAERFRVRDVHTPPLWLQVIHERN